MQAKNLINHLLQADPTLRPTMGQILNDDFFHCGYLPPRLPTTCLSMPPRFDRDLPNQTLNGPSHSASGAGGYLTTGGQMISNGMICTNNMGSNGNTNGGGVNPINVNALVINGNGNGQMMTNGSNGGMMQNGGIGSVSASLRKPLLEINDGKSTQTLDSGVAMSGLMNGRNMDSRAPSAASNVQQGQMVPGSGTSQQLHNVQQQQHLQQLQQQQQMQQASGSSGSAGRNRMVDVVETPSDRHDDAPEDYYISDLYNQLTQVIAAKPTEIEPLRIGKISFFFII